MWRSLDGEFILGNWPSPTKLPRGHGVRVSPLFGATWTTFGWREYERIKEANDYHLEYDPVNNQWKMVM